MNESSTKAAALIGEEISKRRKLARLKQKDLAGKLNMKVPQLCKIEKGKNLPTPRMLRDIEDALLLNSGSLVELRKQLVDLCIAEDSGQQLSPLERLKPACDEHSFTEKNLIKLAEHLIPRLDRYIELENELKFVHFCRLGLTDLPTSTMKHGIVFAHAIRFRLNVGETPLHDILPILEQHNVRILFVPDKLMQPMSDSRPRHGFVFHDCRYDHPVICINEKSAPVSQLYEIAYWFGSYLRYRHRLQKHQPKRSRYDESVFCRAFASTLLMPETAIIDLLDSLRIEPGQWTTDLLDAVANRFGTSALAMVYRLESLKRMEPATCIQLQKSLRSPEWHKAHGKFTDRAPLFQETWLKLLTERAKLS